MRLINSQNFPEHEAEKVLYPRFAEELPKNYKVTKIKEINQIGKLL